MIKVSAISEGCCTLTYYKNNFQTWLGLDSAEEYCNCLDTIAFSSLHFNNIVINPSKKFAIQQKEYKLLDKFYSQNNPK